MAIDVAALDKVLADADFRPAYAFTLAREIGYHAPDPSDPNPTKDGVTQETYDTFRGLSHYAPVLAMTDAERAYIYASYWLDSGCDKISQDAPMLARFVFDAAFNEGTGEAVRLLQEIVGAKIDGEVGPKTLLNIGTYLQGCGGHEDGLCLAYSMRRVRAYTTIVQEKPALRPNYLGWIIRDLQLLNANHLVRGI